MIRPYLFKDFLYVHRDEFDEEKEPDGMLLSGWTQAPSAEDSNKYVDRKARTSEALQLEDETNNDLEIALANKRKLFETSKNACTSSEIRNNHQSEVVDDDDDLFMLDGNPCKKRRNQ